MKIKWTVNITNVEVLKREDVNVGIRKSVAEARIQIVVCVVTHKYNYGGGKLVIGEGGPCLRYTNQVL